MSALGDLRQSNSNQSDIDTISGRSAHYAGHDHEFSCRPKSWLLIFASRTCSPNSHNCRDNLSILPGVGAENLRLTSAEFFLNAVTRAADSATLSANREFCSARLI